MSDLHQAIMNISHDPRFNPDSLEYAAGHADARHAAAELAAEFVASLPRWHDRPTGPGKWFDQMNRCDITLDRTDIELYWRIGWPFGRVFGPIPPDSQGEE